MNWDIDFSSDHIIIIICHIMMTTNGIVYHFDLNISVSNCNHTI